MQSWVLSLPQSSWGSLAKLRGTQSGGQQNQPILQANTVISHRNSSARLPLEEFSFSWKGERTSSSSQERTSSSSQEECHLPKALSSPSPQGDKNTKVKSHDFEQDHPNLVSGFSTWRQRFPYFKKKLIWFFARPSSQINVFGLERCCEVAPANPSAHLWGMLLFSC